MERGAEVLLNEFEGLGRRCCSHRQQLARDGAPCLQPQHCHPAIRIFALRNRL